MKNLFLGILIFTFCKVGAQTPASAVADSLYATTNFTAAIKAYEALPASSKTTLQIARSYRGLGLKKKALDYYNRSLTNVKKEPITATEYGKLLYTQRDFTKADSIFSILVQEYPENPSYHYEHGRSLKQLYLKQPDSIRKANAGKDRGYVAAFAKAVSLDSTHQKAILNLAQYQLTQLEYPLVQKLCNKALEAAPDNVEIISLLAQNYYLRGFHSEAADNYERLLELGQNEAFIHERLGFCYYEERMYELAIEQYKILLKTNEEDWGLHYTLAKLYNFVKDYKKSLEHNDLALYYKDLPLDDIYMTRGTTYRLEKKWEEAINAFQEAIKENPGEGNAYHSIAICADNYYRDKKAVVALYKRFIDKFKDNPKYKYAAMLAERRVKKLREEIFMEKDGY
jgi:tetratricopeptide (TPR) repeat protein